MPKLEFTLLTKEQIAAAENPRLPVALQRQVEEADSLQRQIVAWLDNHPRSGRPKKPRPHKPATTLIVGTAKILGTLALLDEAIAQHCIAIGKRTRGNRRIGKSALQADLIAFFRGVRLAGGKLSVSKIIPKRLATPQFMEILRRHGYITGKGLTDTQRKVVGAQLERQLRQAANFVAEKCDENRETI